MVNCMAQAYNKRVSGFVLSVLRPNPSLMLRTSDTRQTLSAIGRKGGEKDE